MDGKSTIRELLGLNIPVMEKKLQDPALPEDKRIEKEKDLAEQKKKKTKKTDKKKNEQKQDTDQTAG